ILNAEAVKQRLLHHRPLAHHQHISRYRRLLNQELKPDASRVFQQNRAGSGMSAIRRNATKTVIQNLDFKILDVTIAGT
ncbi:hypothetical protein, partial [Parasphingorhabdus sp.]|uniref:hypothetical protein n=1 Tax=Parasphingorhabdus sp. TaxID=2709688 RepID=UPI0032EED020